MLWYVLIRTIWLMTFLTIPKIQCIDNNDRLNLVKVSDFDDIVEYANNYNALNNFRVYSSSTSHANKKSISTYPTLTPTPSRRRSADKTDTAQSTGNSKEHDNGLRLNEESCNDLLSKILEYNALKRKLRQLTVAFKRKCGDKNYDGFVDHLINTCMSSLMSSNSNIEDPSYKIRQVVTNTPCYNSTSNVERVAPTGFTTKTNTNESSIEKRNNNSNSHVVRINERCTNQTCRNTLITDANSASIVKLQPVSSESIASLKNEDNPEKLLLVVRDKRLEDYNNNHPLVLNRVAKGSANYILSSPQVPNLMRRYLKTPRTDNSNNALYGIFYPVKDNNVLVPRSLKRQRRNLFSNFKHNNNKPKRLHAGQKSVKLKKVKFSKKRYIRDTNPCIRKEIQYMQNVKTILEELTQLELYMLNRQLENSSKNIGSGKEQPKTRHTSKFNETLNVTTKNAAPCKKFLDEDYLLQLHQEIIEGIQQLNSTIQQYRQCIEENVPHHHHHHHYPSSPDEFEYHAIQSLPGISEENIYFKYYCQNFFDGKTLYYIDAKEKLWRDYNYYLDDNNNNNYNITKYLYKRNYKYYNDNNKITNNNTTMATTPTEVGDINLLNILSSSSQTTEETTTETTSTQTFCTTTETNKNVTNSMDDVLEQKVSLSTLLYGLSPETLPPNKSARYPISIPVVSLGERYFFTIDGGTAKQPYQFDSELYTTTESTPSVPQEDTVERLERDMAVANEIEDILGQIKQDSRILRKRKNKTVNKTPRKSKNFNRHSISSFIKKYKNHKKPHKLNPSKFSVNSMDAPIIRAKRHPNCVNDQDSEVTDCNIACNTSSSVDPSNTIISTLSPVFKLVNAPIISPVTSHKTTEVPIIITIVVPEDNYDYVSNIENLSTESSTVSVHTSTKSLNKSILPIDVIVNEDTSTLPEFTQSNEYPIKHFEHTNNSVITVVVVVKITTEPTTKTSNPITEEPSWALSQYKEHHPVVNGQSLFSNLTPQIIVLANPNDNDSIFILKSNSKMLENAINGKNGQTQSTLSLNQTNTFLETLYEATTASMRSSASIKTHKTKSNKTTGTQSYQTSTNTTKSSKSEKSRRNKKIVVPKSLRYNLFNKLLSKTSRKTHAPSVSKIPLLSESEVLGTDNKTLLLLDEENKYDEPEVVVTMNTSEQKVDVRDDVSDDNFMYNNMVLNEYTTESVDFYIDKETERNQQSHRETINRNSIFNAHTLLDLNETKSTESKVLSNYSDTFLHDEKDKNGKSNTVYKLLTFDKNNDNIKQNTTNSKGPVNPTSVFLPTPPQKICF
ncbi:hypothetical protein FQR65_LT08939 [Abscondita terminalis]|nr:hypothetical protein FQR65_LT08939 [Abscondita terminalis]